MKLVMDKPRLQRMYIDFLETAGYEPSIEDNGDIAFKIQDLWFFIEIYDEDLSFNRLCLMVSADFDETTMVYAYIAASELNGSFKLTKTYIRDGNIEAGKQHIVFVLGYLLERPGDFKENFERMINEMLAAYKEFDVAMENLISSNDEGATPRCNVDKETTQAEIEDMSQHEELAISCSEIPDWIGGLQKTKSLALSGGFSSIPDAIGNLKQLEHLSFNSNRLKLIPDAVGDLKSLKSLYVDASNSKVSDGIGNLSNLETLTLSINNVKCLPDAIGKLSNLKKLNIDCGNLEIIPEAIGELSSLEDLRINTAKELVLPNAICRLPNLKLLSIRGKLPEDIGLLRSLERLHVYCISTRPGKIPRSISGLVNLELFNVHTDSDVIPEEIGGLVSLRQLEIQFENAPPKMPQSINRLENLEVCTIKKR